MIDLSRSIRNGSPNVEVSRNIQRSYAPISKAYVAGTPCKNLYRPGQAVKKDPPDTSVRAPVKKESVTDKRERRVSMFETIDRVYMDSIMVNTGIPVKNDDGYGY